uniref:Uncharacterized protein n=1 Tax=Arundo donax TaxID=35708 RepID=A0A0A9DLC1_ARUDO
MHQIEPGMVLHDTGSNMASSQQINWNPPHHNRCDTVTVCILTD